MHYLADLRQEHIPEPTILSVAYLWRGSFREKKKKYQNNSSGAFVDCTNADDVGVLELGSE